jgi:magnesium transporter
MITYWQQEDGKLVKKNQNELNSNKNTWVDARCVTRDDIQELISSIVSGSILYVSSNS